MDKQLFLILNLLSLLMNLGSIFFIRQMIWSIVWCDKGGKYNHLRKLKENQGFVSKYSMVYLRTYTNDHSKAFDFWLTVKRIQTVFCIASVLLSVVFAFVYDSVVVFANSYCMVYTIISFLVAICFTLQFDTNRNTKYDRARIRKKNSRKSNK